ncbi:type II toxin-antitoxin system prevent-host-death family antitoxin [Cnuibacter sp. UC19_7]|uniref:type II toxin-antitoxin system prevent-host-death family antitoxin n=1 Tax=Cnuibacter sp. UC19_7 TaxID=3350166 RepID=UPI00366A5858
MTIAMEPERTMSVGQLRQNPAPMVHDVESGLSWVLTNHGRPFGVVVPYVERRWVGIDAVVDLLRSPAAREWADELEADRAAVDGRDPWG